MALPIVFRSCALVGPHSFTPTDRPLRKGPPSLSFTKLRSSPLGSSCRFLSAPITTRALGRTVVVVAQLEERQFEGVRFVAGEPEPATLIIESLSSRELELKGSLGEDVGLEGGGGSGGLEGGFGGEGSGGRGDGANNHNNNSDNSGEGEGGQEKDRKMLISQKLTLGYAALVGAGGLVGFLKRGSKKSMAAGGLSALLLFYVSTKLPTHPMFASSLGLGVSAALLGTMGSRFNKSGKIFPAGVVSLVSVIMTGGYLHGIFRSLHA